tara:strand:+ start:479 stop:865 length:387 start_codon:yes stop_codon:yes gene_type:complete
VTRLELLRRRHGLVSADRKEIGMSVTTIAVVPTSSGSRYLQQLCKHWSHNLDVEFTPEHGTVRFPAEGRAGTFPGDAVLTMDARDEALDVRIDASVAEQRDVMKDVVARHLDRFAFREAPLAFNWQDG